MTLIELCCVLALIMIVSAIALPYIQNTMQSYRAQGDVNALYAQFTQAKMRASSTFSHSKLVCSATQISSQPGCQVFTKAYGLTTWTLETAGSFVLSQGNTFPSTWSGISVGAGTQSSTAPSQTLSICFTTRGTPVSCTDDTNVATNDVLYLQLLNNVNYAISVSISGNQSIFRWTGAAWQQVS